MAKIWNGEITIDTNWGGDASTGGLPVSGERIQAWIKANIKTDDQLRVWLVENGYGAGSGEVTKALVAIEGEQTITGLKNFANGLKLFGIPFKYDAAQGGLLVEGGFAAKGGFFSNGQKMYFDTSKQLWLFTKGISVLGSIYSNNMPLVYDAAKACWVFTESISTPKSLIVNDAPITYDKEKKCWVFTGDMLVSGGLATFSNITGFTPSTIMDGIKVDGSSISKEKGFLEVKSSIGAGSIMEGLVIDDITLKKVSNDAGVQSLAINTDNPLSYIPVDGVTITYDAENKYFKVIGGTSSGGDGTSGGVTLEQLQEILKGYAQTSGSLKNPSMLYWYDENGIFTYYDGSEGKWLPDFSTLITSAKIIEKLGFTPYNAETNSKGFVTSSAIPTELKNPYALKWTGGSSGSYDGSSAQTITIPTVPASLPNPSALSWSGYSTGSYNGSEAKSIAIPSKVSQLSNDSNFITSSAVDTKLANYLPKAGGTITGSLTVNGKVTAKAGIDVTGDLAISGHIASLTTSDERLKENIRTFSATEILQSMGGVKQYEYTEEEVKRNPANAGTHIGFIYQDVEKSQMADKMCCRRVDGYGALNYLTSDYQALLAAVILEQADKIKRLEEMLNPKTA